jgi:hypothetical protein
LTHQAVSLNHARHFAPFGDLSRLTSVHMAAAPAELQKGAADPASLWASPWCSRVRLLVHATGNLCHLAQLVLDFLDATAQPAAQYLFCF